MWSHLTVYLLVKGKKPGEVIEKIMTHLIGTEFDVMKAILTDNGGEFSSDEIREVARILNIKVCTSAAQCAPFQNGLCERIHAVTDAILMNLEQEHAEISLDVHLCWTNTARDSLQRWHGYSSYQLVFGKNPNLAM